MEEAALYWKNHDTRAILHFTSAWIRLAEQIQHVQSAEKPT